MRVTHQEAAIGKQRYDLETSFQNRLRHSFGQNQ